MEKTKNKKGGIIMDKKQKKPLYKRWWFIVLIICVVIGAINSGEDESDNREKSVVTNERAVEKEAVIENENVNDEEILYNVTGELSIEFKDGKAIATVTTNAIDGAIFETMIMDGNFNVVSDFITIENGIGTKEFDIPKEWDIGYVSGSAMMRFNLDEYPQPDHVKELYGEYGENLTGDFAIANNLNGNNINLDIITVAYPNEETVRAKLDELFIAALNELIEISDGVIVKIQPHFKDGDWSSVAVTVSDAWYYSAEYEKERFAEQVGTMVEAIVKNAAKVSSDKYVSVYFYDTYGKELASPKVFGGYKIKR